MMASQSVVLTASNNPRSRKNPDSKIAVRSSLHQFTFFNEINQIGIRVGADINLTKGLYYLDWDITEVGYGGQNVEDSHYHHPMKTKVEVVAKVTGKFQFKIENFAGGATYKGTNSPSIRVYVDNAPFSDVTVNLALLGGTNENITFEPSTLTFGPDVTEKFFSIKIDSDYNLTTANP